MLCDTCHAPHDIGACPAQFLVTSSDHGPAPRVVGPEEMLRDAVIALANAVLRLTGGDVTQPGYDNVQRDARHFAAVALRTLGAPASED